MKEPIPHAAKWAALDETLRRIDGIINCDHDDVIRGMVKQLKNPSRSKDDVSTDTTSSES